MLLDGYYYRVCFQLQERDYLVSFSLSDLALATIAITLILILLFGTDITQ